jgi:hypothetical protein
MLLKLTIPTQRSDILYIYKDTVAIFEVIGYYQYEPDEPHWVLSPNVPFISNFIYMKHYFTVILLNKYPTLHLDLSWKENLLDWATEEVEEYISKRDVLRVEAVEVIKNYPQP